MRTQEPLCSRFRATRRRIGARQGAAQASQNRSSSVYCPCWLPSLDTYGEINKQIEGTMSLLNSKIALVTGGSRGFGRAIVEALTAEGATVYALARDAGHLDQLKREVKGVHTYAADVADPQVAPRLLREIRPDILVLSAGATPRAVPIHEQTWEEFGRSW